MRTLMCFLLVASATCYKASAQVIVLHAFSQTADSGPANSPVEVSPGVFLGTTETGVLFRVTSGGAFQPLAQFSAPLDLTYDGNLVPASNGYFYGAVGNASGPGGIFAVTPTGKVQIVNSSLNGPAPVVEAVDGNLWGVQGSSVSGYNVYKMSLDGVASMVYSLGSAGETISPLAQAANGSLYGTTYSPAAGGGTIYRITPEGEFTGIYTFPNEQNSIGGLTQASNGVLYGTALSASATCSGQVGELFSMTLEGKFEAIHEFKGCSGGVSAGPSAGLVEASDGNLYGTTLGGGDYGYGTVFRIGLDGSAFETVLSFSLLVDGGVPSCLGTGLTQGMDGNLYGTTVSGGPDQGGVVFRLDLGLAPPLPNLSFIQPRAGAPGTTVRLTGNHLLGLSAVTFNGVPSAFTSVGVSYANAVVPAGATAGPITVTTANGSFTTKSIFTVE